MAHTLNSKNNHISFLWKSADDVYTGISIHTIYCYGGIIMKSTVSAPCKSVFRDGTAAITKETYTKLWTSLINQMERNKKTLARTK